jgi:hypothetical protein
VLRELTRYLKKCRIVGLAGLISLALSALPPAPAGARVICPPGATNRNYCRIVITLTVRIIIRDGRVTVRIHVTDPHIKVTLRHKHTVRTLLARDANGNVTIPFRKPTDPGSYEVRAVATANHVTKTVVKHFTIKKPKKHKKHK